MNAFSVILVAFLTSVLTAFGTVYVIERKDLFARHDQTPKKETVPNLVGLSETDAKTNLEATGLKLLVAGREATSAAEPGTVVRQSPLVGQSLDRGQAVSVTFAIGLPKVPDVLGRPVDDAKRALEAAGYVVKLGDAVPTAEREKGLVVSQLPTPGSALPLKDTVTLQPSAGPAAVPIPKLVGLNVKNAEKEAEKANLKLTIQWVSLAETSTYVVLRQEPKAGENGAPGSEVKVTVNR